MFLVLRLTKAPLTWERSGAGVALNFSVGLGWVTDVGLH